MLQNTTESRLGEAGVDTDFRPKTLTKYQTDQTLNVLSHGAFGAVGSKLDHFSQFATSNEKTRRIIP